MIEIKGFMKTSMLDYPGKLSACIFLSKCNFRCPYCHNVELVNDDVRLIPFETEKVFDYLDKKKKWMDGVVISGGEPTLHKDLPDLCKKIKDLGYSIKLDTNGTNPKMLKELIDNKLVDYVAIDIKSSKKKYDTATNVKSDITSVEASVKLLMDSSVDYEFRSTVLPGIIDIEDMKDIGKWINGAKRYYIQQFIPIKTLNESFMEKDSHTHATLHEMKKIMDEYVELCEIRGAS